MIFNATLLRLDPPPPAPQGPDVVIRCAVTTETIEQARRTRDLGLTVWRVAYVPLRKVPPAGPEVGGRALVRTDAEGVSTLYEVVEIIEHAGRTLGHVQVALAKL